MWDEVKLRLKIESVISKTVPDRMMYDLAYDCYTMGYNEAWVEIRALGKAIESSREEPVSGAV